MAAKKDAGDGRKLVASNRRAFHDYTVDERIEAGLVLVGSEVKSLRTGKASLQEAYAVIEDGEAWLVSAHIAPYPQAHEGGHDPLRKRKLLLHLREIEKLRVRVREKGYTLIPLSLYFRGGRAKIEIGVARGKRQYDKRASTMKREAERDIARAMKRHR